MLLVHLLRKKYILGFCLGRQDKKGKDLLLNIELKDPWKEFAFEGKRKNSGDVLYVIKNE